MVQPARIQTAWATLFLCTMFWGFFSAARLGESNTQSGTGEYFKTCGLSATRQLFEIWLAVSTFIIPLALAAVAICLFAAMPSNADERNMWWLLNLQYFALFILVFTPLLALAIAIASRFGATCGFAVTFLITLYGLYGVGYLDQMLQIEANKILEAIWLYSPQYRYADLTQRLYFKTGALSGDVFANMFLYFTAILAITAGISRLCFRTNQTA